MNNFSEATQKLKESPAKEICDRLLEISQEQDRLFKQLKELIPMSDNYKFIQTIDGVVRPYYFGNKYDPRSFV